MPIPDSVQTKIKEKLKKKPVNDLVETMAPEETAPESAVVNTTPLEEAKPKGEYIESPKPPTTEKKELVSRIGEILQQYNNQESNIPVEHEYWKLVKAYRNA